MNTDKLRFEITVMPAGRRIAHGTTPPPLPSDGSVDVELEDALDSAAQQLAGVDIDALFADNAGRELVDLVDRSHFHLAAHQPEPLFQLDHLFEDTDDPPTS